MLLFRRLLVWTRLRYLKDPKDFFIKFGALSLLAVIIGVLTDAFIPFDGPYGLFMVLRSALLIPAALVIFILGYGIAIFGHQTQTANNPQWVAYRARYSPTWRRRISIIIGAALIVLIVGSQQGITYTVSSFFIGAAAIALVAFLRVTKEEANREEFDIPDPRDLEWQTREKFARKQREEKQAAKKSKKTRKA